MAKSQAEYQKAYRERCRAHEASLRDAATEGIVIARTVRNLARRGNKWAQAVDGKTAGLTLKNLEVWITDSARLGLLEPLDITTNE